MRAGGDVATREDGLGRASRNANAAIDAFVGVNDEHVLADIEAVDGAHFDAIHVLAFDAVVRDDVGHQPAFSPALWRQYKICF
jgi:hypothetical protein